MNKKLIFDTNTTKSISELRLFPIQSQQKIKGIENIKLIILVVHFQQKVPDRYGL
jgi:hypothetical protein